MDYENLPFTGKVSLVACLGGRIMRPKCTCCGGHLGVRRARRRLDKFATDYEARVYVTRGKKPKHKDHR